MNFHNSITVIEPTRGVQLMLALNSRVVKHELLVRLLPLTADIFVFTYPIYLVVLYLRGMRKANDRYKQAALTIFSSAALAAGINILIQYFGSKSRPESAVIDKAHLILEHLPTDPFPSDHAAVSAAIAMATLLRGMRYRDKRFLWLAVFFGLCCVVMSVSRVAVAIHRPTDVLIGRGVGSASAACLFIPAVRKWISQKVFAPLIAFEHNLCMFFVAKKR